MRTTKRLVAVRPNGLNDTSQLQIDIDHTKAGAYGLSVAQINDALSSAWGSAYVDDFVNAGRVKKVYMQADARFRMQPECYRHQRAGRHVGRDPAWDLLHTPLLRGDPSGVQEA